jgi:hypothetical protein
MDIINRLRDAKEDFIDRNATFIVWCEMVVQFLIIALIIYIGVLLLGFMHS